MRSGAWNSRFPEGNNFGNYSVQPILGRGVGVSANPTKNLPGALPREEMALNHYGLIRSTDVREKLQAGKRLRSAKPTLKVTFRNLGRERSGFFCIPPKQMIFWATQYIFRWIRPKAVLSSYALENKCALDRPVFPLAIRKPICHNAPARWNASSRSACRGS